MTHRPSHTEAPKRIRVFFDIGVGGQKAGRITFELRNDVVPRTAENVRFRLLSSFDLDPSFNCLVMAFSRDYIHMSVEIIFFSFAHYALAKKERPPTARSCTTKALRFTVSFRASCCREATSLG